MQKEKSLVEVSNVKFSDINGTSACPIAVSIECSESKPCQGIELNNINLSLSDGGETTSLCANANITYSGTQNPPPCKTSYIVN